MEIARACSMLRLLVLHNVDDDNTVSDGLLSSPLPSGGGVTLYCVCLFVVLVFASVHFICTNVSPFYMIEQCSYLFKKH